MIKEKLEKEAIKWLRKFLLCCNCEKKCSCIDSKSYCEEQVLKAYIDGAEPREKRIAELETRCNELFLQTNEQAEQIEKIKSDVIECFGSEYNVLVAKLLNKWEKEHRND